MRRGRARGALGLDESQTTNDKSSAQLIATWSAAGGAVAVLLLSAISGRLRFDQQSGAATLLGSLGFTVAMLAPFVLALGARMRRAPLVRRAAWLASGTLAIMLGIMTLFNGLGWWFGVTAIGLLAAWRISRPHAQNRGSARPLIVAAWLILWLGSALWALDLRGTPACWNESGAGSGWLPVATTGSCTSDIVDDSEGLLALACVAVGFAGAALLAQDRGSGKQSAHIGRSTREASPEGAHSLFSMVGRSAFHCWRFQGDRLVRCGSAWYDTRQRDRSSRRPDPEPTRN